ncbi:type-F conjugative transfer system pilin acetylase TraX [Salmonella enterica subsp. enterica]|nr:type-F conjugative transfer system pilin acetylase TraX [Salmonella enterica subsp. enterica]
MSTTTTTPAVYVGTYHKYNCGSIFGKWFDLTEFDGREDFYEACQALHADEWDAEFMFQDWEGIPSQFVSECSIDWNFIAAYKRAEEEGIATAFQLDMPLLNMAGRCAFPLFALVSGCNLAGKTLRQHSLNRLWLMALLAQPGYWLAFREAGLMWWQLNILFAFAVVMQVTRFLQAATVLNGVAAFTALVGYLPLSSASYGIPGLLMLAGALLIWQVRDSLRPALFAVWLLLVALLNARHGDVMTLSGVLLTLTVLFCVHGLVPALGRRLQAGRWFAPAYALHLLCISFLVSVL